MVHIINTITHWFSNFSCIEITSRLGKPQIAGPLLQKFDSVALESGQRICISHKFPHAVLVTIL